jgi:hypothetical protein
MPPVDYQNIQHQLRARRHQLIAEISSELDETLWGRLADVQSAIAAVEAEEQDALPGVVARPADPGPKRGRKDVRGMRAFALRLLYYPRPARRRRRGRARCCHPTRRGVRDRTLSRAGSRSCGWPSVRWRSAPGTAVAVPTAAGRSRTGGQVRCSRRGYADARQTDHSPRRLPQQVEHRRPRRTRPHGGHSARLASNVVREEVHKPVRAAMMPGPICAGFSRLVAQS